jgi:hypothetical protein
LSGGGSQYKIKREVASLFDPKENMEWQFGTPNTSNFIQERMNPSLKQNNTKPFESIRVGPSLRNNNGIKGTDGYNSSLECRNKYMPKSVDELRVKSNPKETYDGVILGGKSSVTNKGILGKTEKYGPDTYYKNDASRYFTTTGIEKAPTYHSSQLLKHANRVDSTTEYYGGMGNTKDKSYVDSNYEDPKRPVLDPYTTQLSNVNLTSRTKREDMQDISN